MGGRKKGGKKTQTISVSEVSVSANHKANSSVSARSLRKGDLAGVIFGCKNYTINECLTQKLFGLPVQHFPYVKNIVPGMPLFLFNYSDRKLHGIFEAASHGRLNINPHGWTLGGSEKTEYPAQVRITVLMQCQALKEDQFLPLIAENYYTDKHFWFELDSEQTKKLISLFKVSSASAYPTIPKKVCHGESVSSSQTSSARVYSAMQKKGFSWCELVKTHPNPDKRTRNVDFEPTCNPEKMNGYDDPQPSVSDVYLENLDWPDLLHIETVDKEEETLVSSKIEEISNNSSSASCNPASAYSAMQKEGFSWCEVVKTHPNPDKRTRNEDFEPTCNPEKMNGYDDPQLAVSDVYLENLAQPDLLPIETVDKEEETLFSSKIEENWNNSSSASCNPASAHSAMQKKGFSWCEVVKTHPNPDKRTRNEDFEPTCNPEKMNGYDDPQPAVSNVYLENLDWPDLLHIETVDKEEETLVSSKIEEISNNSSDHFRTTAQEMKVAIAGPVTNGMPSGEQSLQEEPFDSNDNRVSLVKSSYHRLDTDQFTADSSVMSKLPSVQNCFQEEPMILAPKEEFSVFPSDSQLVIAQLRQEVQTLLVSSYEQLKKTRAMEDKLVVSQVQIQELNSRVKKLESNLHPYERDSFWGP